MALNNRLKKQIMDILLVGDVYPWVSVKMRPRKKTAGLLTHMLLKLNQLLKTPDPAGRRIFPKKVLGASEVIDLPLTPFYFLNTIYMSLFSGKNRDYSGFIAGQSGWQVV